MISPNSGELSSLISCSMLNKDVKNSSLLPVSVSENIISILFFIPARGGTAPSTG